MLRANVLWAVAVNAALAVAGYFVGGVRGSGVIAATVYGIVIYSFAGYSVFSILFFFLLILALATKMGTVHKKRLGISEDSDEGRGAPSVIGKCTTAAVVAVVIGLAGGMSAHGVDIQASELARWLALAYAGAMASALADTCASELGPLYGDRPIILTTLQPVTHGTPGGVSAAGTTLGLAAAILLGLLATAAGVVREKAILYLLISSLCASVLDSYMRARWPGAGFFRKQLTNITVTTAGAVIAVLLAMALGY
ncbi:MAG: TIGR00297 family protein [Candidatus Abyssubacteria bacterium]